MRETSDARARTSPFRPIWRENSRSESDRWSVACESIARPFLNDVTLINLLPLHCFAEISFDAPNLFYPSLRVNFLSVRI